MGKPGRCRAVREGRQVKCIASLFEKENDPPTFSKQLPLLSLPITSKDWKPFFTKYFRESAQKYYDAATLCRVEFSAEELGSISFDCEREFSPLRWVLRLKGRTHVMKLLDDSGSSSLPNVTYRSFERPSIEVALSLSITNTNQYVVPPKGGMYVATQKSYEASAIAPPTITGFSDLRCTPQIDSQARSVESILGILDILRAWSNARLPGDFISAQRQHDVFGALTRNIFKIIGGVSWEREELDASEGAKKVTRLKNAISKISGEKVIGTVLELHLGDLAAMHCRERVERLSSLTQRYSDTPWQDIAAKLSQLFSQQLPKGSSKRSVWTQKSVSNENWEWLTELGLRLASSPLTVETWAGDRLRAGLTLLLENPMLGRVARFLVIMIDSYLISSSTEKTHESWQWK